MLHAVRFLKTGAAARAFVFLLGTTLIGGCSLKSASHSARLSLSLPNPHRASLAQQYLSGGSQGLAPSAWNAPEFVCYGVNVTGPGIPDSSSNPDPNPDISGLLAGTTSCAYRGIVSNGFTFSANSPETVIDLQVPPGSNRVIQLIGITNPDYCASNFLEQGGNTSPGAYEIGSVRADLFGDATVSIPISYTAANSTAKRVDCGSGSAATVLAVDLTSIPGSGAFVNASNVSSFSISGTCSEIGQPVTVKVNGTALSPVPSCVTGGVWSEVFDFSSFSDGTLTVTADHSSSGGASAPTASRTVTKDTVAPTGGATSLTWSHASPTNSRTLVASWNSSDPSVGSEKVQFYGDSACTTAVGTVIDAGMTKTATYVAATDGTFTFKVTSFDAAGNSIISGCSSSLVVDTVVPTVAITSPAAGSYVNTTNASTFTLSGTCSENGSSVSISGAATFSATCSAGAWTATVSVGAAPDGSITLYADHVDAAGNAAVQALRTFTKDTVIPTVAITSPAAGSYVNTANASAFPVSGTCSENGSSVTISGAASGTAACTGGAWAANLNLSGAADGVVTVNAMVADAAGNAATISRNFTKDVSAPTVAITSPLAGAYANSANVGALPLNGTCSESGQPVTITAGVASTSGSCVSGFWSASLNLTGVADGNVTIIANHMDAAGNSASISTVTILKDTVAPSVAITSPAAGSFVNLSNVTAFTVSGTCTENGQNVVLSGGVSSVSTACTGGVWSATVDLSPLGEGGFSIKADLSDPAGNAAAQVSRAFTKDTVVPTLASVTVSNVSPSYTNVFSFTNGGVSEGSGTYKHCILVNDTNSANCTWVAADLPSSFVIPAVSGTIILSFWVVDLAGNISARVDANSVNYDNSCDTLAGNGASAGTAYVIDTPIRLQYCLPMKDAAAAGLYFVMPVASTISASVLTTSLPAFHGFLDGKGTTLAGFNQSGGSHGLFQSVVAGSVKNLAFSNVNLNCTVAPCGIVAGSVTDSVIGGIVVSGSSTISAGPNYDVGGLVGRAEGASQFVGNTVNGVVISSTSGGTTGGVGGLVGTVLKSSTAAPAPADFYQNQVVASSLSTGSCASDVGGLVGFAMAGVANASFVFDQNFVDFSVSCSSGTANRVGGAIGNLGNTAGNYTGVTYLLKNFNVVGNIQATGTAAWIGGIVGIVNFASSDAFAMQTSFFGGNENTAASAKGGLYNFNNGFMSATVSDSFWLQATQYVTTAGTGTPSTVTNVSLQMSSALVSGTGGIYPSGTDWLNSSIWDAPGAALPKLTIQP